MAEVPSASTDETSNTMHRGVRTVRSNQAAKGSASQTGRGVSYRRKLIV